LFAWNLLAEFIRLKLCMLWPSSASLAYFNGIKKKTSVIMFLLFLFLFWLMQYYAYLACQIVAMYCVNVLYVRYYPIALSDYHATNLLTNIYCHICFSGWTLGNLRSQLSGDTVYGLLVLHEFVDQIYQNRLSSLYFIVTTWTVWKHFTLLTVYRICTSFNWNNCWPSHCPYIFGCYRNYESSCGMFYGDEDQNY
jgi:hypothetical protein